MVLIYESQRRRISEFMEYVEEELVDLNSRILAALCVSHEDTL